MLILKRKVGQQILNGKGVIQIKVLKVNDGILSIGLIAPKNIYIDREEIYIKKLAQCAPLFNHRASR